MNDEWREIGAEAARHLREGRFGAAAHGFERVVALNPDHADSWFNLGYCRRHARDFRAAVEAYGEALKRGVRGPEDVHVNRAAILSEHLHDIAGAQRELESAIAINPRAVVAWLNLGSLHEDRGDFDAARAAYRGALGVHPASGRALARLSMIDVYEGAPERAVEALRAVDRGSMSGADEQAEMAFALANALDAAGEHAAAFAEAREANRLAASSRDPARRYDRRTVEELIDDIIAAFPARPTARAAAPQAPVIFVCGMFRSGSTLVEQTLGRHHAIVAGGELDFLPAMVGEHLLPYPQSLAGLDDDRLDALRQAYVAQMRALFPEAALVTDKRPDNWLHIGLIKTLFPDAKIVHTLRDPRDNLLSVFFLYFADGVPYSDSNDDFVHYYGQYRRLMAHWQALFGEDIVTVDYDALVADPRSTLEALLAGLGLDWDDAVLNAAPADEAVRTPSSWQVRAPLHARSSGRWRHYEKEVAAYGDALGASLGDPAA